MDPSVTLVPATGSSASDLADLLIKAFREYESLYSIGGFSATTPDATVVASRLREGPTWIALEGGKIVGTVSAVQRETGTYIRSMAVLPSMQGQGMGRALLGAVEQFARLNGSPRLYLSTTPFLHDAIRLYEANGYTRTNEPPFDLHGTPLFTMEKRLSPRT